MPEEFSYAKQKRILHEIAKELERKSYTFPRDGNEYAAYVGAANAVWKEHDDTPNYD